MSSTQPKDTDSTELTQLTEFTFSPSCRSVSSIGGIHFKSDLKKLHSPTNPIFRNCSGIVANYGLTRELRLRIWKFALHGPRTITMTASTIDTGYTEPSTGHTKLVVQRKYHGVRPTPSMHVSSGGREVDLSTYEPAFGEDLSAKPIYVDWDCDCVYFESTHAFRRYCVVPRIYLTTIPTLPPNVNSWETKARHLSIGGDNFGDYDIRRMCHLGTLKTLILQHQDEFTFYDDNNKDEEPTTAGDITLQKSWKKRMTLDTAAMPVITFVTGGELYRQESLEKVSCLRDVHVGE